MCGIAGFNWPDLPTIQAMTDSLRHRGPDDEGFYVDDAISLGHRRLAIIDLSDLGHQPMVYEYGGRTAIVTFNGEIFNFREIRAELMRMGYTFRSDSDTELLLAAYLAWGAEGVGRLNGMWAFALYDRTQGHLLLSRDRFGEKPLHYRFDNGQLIFASEIKAILAHPIRRRADSATVSEYLYKGRAQGGTASFFEDIRMLPPAHNALLELRSKRMRVTRYYEPKRGTRRIGSEEVLGTLDAAVRRRLVSDVPVSISLSSGIDSTSVAALMAKSSIPRVKAFTTTSEHDVGDETALITRFLSRYPQFDLEQTGLSEDRFCRHYREIIFHMDEPFARQSAYVRWEIARLAHTNARKVMLNGEGADEILGGYASFVPPFILHLLKDGHPLRFAQELLALVGHPERERILREIRAFLSHRTPRRAGREMESNDLQRRFEIKIPPRASESTAHTDIKDFLGSQVHDYSLPRLLVSNDKMSMANSVEGRAPFLDHEFVDMAFSMDPTELMVAGARKYPLRRAMKGLVPDEILLRKSKDAFNAPIFEYLRSDTLKQRIREVFREPRTATVFSPRAYTAEYDRFLSRKAADRSFLLHGLFLEEWARMFEVEFA